MAKKEKPENGKQPVVEEIETEQPVDQETAPAEEAPAQPEEYVLSGEEFAKLQEHIQSLQKEKDDMVHLLQRNQADFDNYRRRNASVRLESYEEGKRDCIKTLLPVLDNFDRAMNEAGGDDAWREGVKLVYKQLHETLEKLGVTEIDASGKFDPALHEAVMQEAAEGREKGDIIAVFQKGYRVGERIVRHSMVKVAE